MTDPKRLVDGDAPDAARKLLFAIDVPRPPDAAKELELAHKLATLTASTGALPAPALGGSWLPVALVCGVLLGGGALWLAMRRPMPGASDSAAITAATQFPVSSPSDVDAQRPEMSRTPGRIADPRAPEPREPEPREDGALRQDAGGSRVQPGAVSNPRRKAAARDLLAEEEALLERVRVLASSSPARAWPLLEKHRRRFPDGQLVAERLFLSFDVLSRLGKKQAAHAQFEALTRKFPGSVYTRELERRSQTPR